MLDVETLGAALKLVKEGGGGGGEGGAVIDDSKISPSTTWSSQKIVDTLCPPFTADGNPVTCTPVANYPLDVQVEITPTQEGTGDPSPENVRPIVGWEAVNIHQSNEDQDKTYTVQLGQTVYGGKISISDGAVQTIYAVVEFDGSDDENWAKLQHESGRIYYKTKVSKSVINANDPSKWMCNRLQPHKYNYATIEYLTFSIGFQSDRISVCIVLENKSTLSVEEFKVWLGENPVQFVYDSDLVDLNFDPKTIPALPGTNTIYADAGAVTVSGLSDTVETFNALENRIAALEEAAISG